jgi:hypothetical protein
MKDPANSSPDYSLYRGLSSGFEGQGDLGLSLLNNGIQSHAVPLT